MGRKPGVSEPSELSSFLETWGSDNIVVVDARNIDFAIEAGGENTDVKLVQRYTKNTLN